MWRPIVIVALLSLAACDSGGSQATPQAGTPERERRDSVLGQSKLPGAGAVERANAIRDTSRSRAAGLDTMRE